MNKTQTAKKTVASKKSLVVDYQRTFSSIEGKRVLGDIIRFTKAFGPTFDQDPVTMAHNEGKRLVALKILTHMKTDLRNLDAMIEAIDQASNGDAQ